MHWLYFYFFKFTILLYLDQCFKKPFLKKIYCFFLYRWGSIASRLQSHYEETVYFLSPGTWYQFNPSWKDESTLEALKDFEPATSGLGIQYLNHQATASTLDPKAVGLNHNYMLSQALGPNLISRLSETFGSYKINCSE